MIILLQNLKVKMISKNKRGEILVENVIFIVLNIAFLSILILFLIKQGTGTVLLEDAHSKQIALLIDSASPGMIMKINLQEGFELSEEKGIPFEEAVTIEGNRVIVKFSEKGGKEYSFFNDVDAQVFPDTEEGIYVLTISKK